MATASCRTTGSRCRAICVPAMSRSSRFRGSHVARRRCGSITRCRTSRSSTTGRGRSWMFDDAALERLREILALRPAMEIVAPQHRRACVLIPLMRNGVGWSILFTRRSENLAAHSGQIAFPGGAVEGAESLEEAAIREAEEEV